MKIKFYPILAAIIFLSLNGFAQNNLDSIVIKNNLFGVVNKKDKSIVIPIEFDEIRKAINYTSYPKKTISSRFFWVKKDKAWSLYNGQKQVTDFLYDMVYSLSENFIPVKKDTLWGAIDTLGNELIPIKYQWVKDISNGVCPVLKIDSTWGAFDRHGKEIVPFIFDEITDLSGLWFCWKKKKANIFIVKTHKLSTITYDEIGWGRKDFHRIKTNNKYGYINSTGSVLIEPAYQLCSDDFNEKMAQVKQNNKWGFINEQGKIVIPCIYDSVDEFHQGTAKIMLNNKWGFIDKNGKVFITPQYADVNYVGFNNGVAIVSEVVENYGKEMAVHDSYKAEPKKMMYLINKKGQRLSSNYDFINYPSEDPTFVVVLGRKEGYIDISGKQFIPCMYDDAGVFYKGVARVVQNGVEFYIDKKNNPVANPY